MKKSPIINRQFNNKARKSKLNYFFLEKEFEREDSRNNFKNNKYPPKERFRGSELDYRNSDDEEDGKKRFEGFDVGGYSRN